MNIVLTLVVAVALTWMTPTQARPTKTITVKTVTKQKSRPSLHLSRIIKPVILADQSDDYYIEAVSYLVCRRPPELVCNDSLSLDDYVNLRLAHARRRALEQYHVLWG